MPQNGIPPRMACTLAIRPPPKGLIPLGGPENTDYCILGSILGNEMPLETCDCASMAITGMTTLQGSSLSCSSGYQIVVAKYLSRIRPRGSTGRC